MTSPVRRTLLFGRDAERAELPALLEHLRNIFRKLGITSRAELGRLHFGDAEAHDGIVPGLARP